MDDGGKRIAHIPVKQEVELDQVRLHILLELIIKGCIAPAAGLELVEKVVNDLIERELVKDVHAVFLDVFHVAENAALFLTKFHDRAHVVRRRHDMRFHHRFFHG